MLGGSGVAPAPQVNYKYLELAASQYLNGGNILSMGNGTVDQAFTVRGWFRNRNTAAQQDYMYKGQWATMQWGIEFGGASNMFNLWIFDGSTANNLLLETTTSLMTQGQFHHLVWGYDGSGLHTGLFCRMDGVDVRNTSKQNGTYNNMQTNTDNFNIGQRQGNAWYSQTDFDDVVIFNKALSAAEADEAYDSGNQTTYDITTHSCYASNKLAYWTMGDNASDDATSGTGQITDESGNGYHLTPQGTVAGDIKDI
jgi:hypothetical protein